MTVAVLLTVAVGCALASPALAADHAEHAPSWGMLAFQVLNVGILIAVLVRYARLPLKDYLAERRSSIARVIDEAEGALRAARAELDDLRARLARADDEATQLERAAAEQAEVER